MLGIQFIGGGGNYQMLDQCLSSYKRNFPNVVYMELGNAKVCLLPAFRKRKKKDLFQDDAQ